jgi:hypothetical protein
MTSEVANGAEAGTEDEQKVKFHYVKSPLYRTVHVDGVIGGLTPQGALSLGIYSERLLYPDQMVYSLTPKGEIGEEIAEERIARDGIGRELEASLVMTLPAARQLARWLIRNIKMAEHSIKEAQAKTEDVAEGGEQ